ncbi:MAG: extracellular solute-binding protein [Clostridiales bacterium]|nr:extracellular solute-binding protein [Clostridiales bacterium]
MKKTVSKILAVLLTATCAMPLFACNKTKNDPNTLNIICVDKGYGTTWIEKVAEKYTQETGVKVNITPSANASSLISTHLASKNNVDDIYINVDAGWKGYASQGKFANLDSLLDETVDGEKVKDLVLPDYGNSIYFPDRDGSLHTYRLPLIAGVGGIYYNKKMFDDNGWNIPETYDELVQLCNTIRRAAVPVAGSDDPNEHVAPFIYTSANIDYFDYAVFTWWAQLAGENNIKQFMKYDSPDIFDANQNATYAHLKTATTMWSELFSNSANYISNDNNHTAQTRFANGYAAMMFNGDWLYNEIINYGITDLSGKFELGYMKTPAATDAVDTDITYTVGDDQYIAVPASSIKQDKAKAFIKLLISDWGCETYINEAHGVLAYKGSLRASTTDSFMSNIIDVKKSYSKAFTSYPPVKDIQNITQSTALLNLNNKVDIWGTGGARPYKRIIDGTSIDNAFSIIKTEVSGQWNDWKRQCGLS